MPEEVTGEREGEALRLSECRRAMRHGRQQLRCRFSRSRNERKVKQVARARSAQSETAVRQRVRQAVYTRGEAADAVRR